MGLPPGTGTSSIVSSERVVAIVQARLGSVRLPGKVLSPVLGKPVLAHLVERLSRADSIDEVVLAIPDTAANNELAVLADELRIGCFRGDEDDVLLRYSDRPISSGEIITAENVRSVRPAGGLAPDQFEAVVGMSSSRAIKQGEPIMWSDLGRSVYR